MNHLDFKLLKVISLLMDYPSDELFADDTLNACKNIRCLFGCLNTYMVRAETVGKRWLI